MITLQPSIAITPNFTEECTNKAHLKSKKVTDTSRSSRPVVFCEKQNILTNFSQNSQKKTCVGVSFLIKLEHETCYFIKIEPQIPVFYENLFCRTTLVAAFPPWVFQINVNICSAFFSTLICFANVLKICIEKNNL